MDPDFRASLRIPILAVQRYSHLYCIMIWAHKMVVDTLQPRATFKKHADQCIRIFHMSRLHKALTFRWAVEASQGQQEIVYLPKRISVFI